MANINMDAGDLEECMGEVMEYGARKLLIKENLAKLEEAAFMTRYNVCERLLEYYEVVARDEDDNVTIVRRENVDKYKSIVAFLSN